MPDDVSMNIGPVIWRTPGGGATIALPGSPARRAGSRAWMLDAIEEACARGAALVAVTHHDDEVPRGVERRLALAGGRLAPR